MRSNLDKYVIYYNYPFFSYLSRSIDAIHFFCQARETMRLCEDKKLLPLISQRKKTEFEIDIANGSKYLASGALVTGNSLRGPHINYGFADDMQDWTREAFEVIKEVVNLPPSQIFCTGTPKEKGSFFEDIWFSSDKKKWNVRNGYLQIVMQTLG